MNQVRASLMETRQQAHTSRQQYQASKLWTSVLRASEGRQYLIAKLTHLEKKRTLRRWEELLRQCRREEDTRKA